MNNSNLTKFTLNLTLANELRDSPIQSLIYSSYIVIKAFHPLKKVHYDSASFNLSNITNYCSDLHLKSPSTY